MDSSQNIFHNKWKQFKIIGFQTSNFKKYFLPYVLEHGILVGIIE